MTITLFDIETIAQPEAKIRASLPPFDPDKVKLGNASKPETVAKIIADAKATYGNDIVERAALDPKYGEIAIAGFYKGQTKHNGVEFIHEGKLDQISQPDMPEEAIIENAVVEFSGAVENGNIIVGWNILGFDLPFILKRAWSYGIKIPRNIFNPARPRYPWNENFVDLMLVFQAGNYRDGFTSMDEACKFLGIKGKSGNGKDFGEVWSRDKNEALEYNACDLSCLYSLAQIML